MAARNFFITWSDPTNPAMGLDFFPPKGSDELHEALKEYYPHLDNLHARMRAAVIDFYLEQQTLDADLMLQQSPEYLTSPNSNSFASSMSTPLTQPIQMQPTSPIVASSVSSSAPRQEDLMNVWTLPSNPDAKIHKRRNMTDSEKAAYKQKRLEGACDDCKRRRRKCLHTAGSASSASSQTSGRRKSKQARRMTSQSDNIAKVFTETFPMDFHFDEPIVPSSQMETTQLNLELDFMNLLDQSASELPWTNDYMNTFDFTKDFELYGEPSNYNTFLPTPPTPHQPNQLTHLSKQAPQAFDIEQFLDLSDHNENRDTSGDILKDRIPNDLFARPNTSRRIPNSSDNQQDYQGELHHRPNLLNLDNQSLDKQRLDKQRLVISDQILGVGSSFTGASQLYNGHGTGNTAVDTSSGGLYQSPVDLFAASPVEPTVSRSGFAVYRSIARRGQQDKRRPTDTEQKDSESETDSSVDRIQVSRTKQRLQSRAASATTSSLVTIETASHNGIEEVIRGRPLTSSGLSSSVDAYTTLTFSIPTSSRIPNMPTVTPSLLATASDSQHSQGSIRQPDMMLKLSSITVTLDAAQQIYSTLNVLLSIFTLFSLLLFSLIGHVPSRNEKTPQKPRISFYHQMVSNAVRYFTLSSLAISVASSRRSLSSSTSWLSGNILVSPLQSISSTT